MRLLNKMPSFSNVAAGSTATLNLPVGLTYEALRIKYTGVTLAQLENIEVRINGKTVQFFDDGVRVDKINQFYERGAASGILTIWFTRPELKKFEHSRLTALGTADVQTLSLHIDINSSASAPVLTCNAEQSNSTNLGLINKIKSFPVTFATSGKQDIDSIPRPGNRIAAIHLFKSDVSAVALDVNSQVVVDALKGMLEEQQKTFDRTPQTAIATHIDFTVDGDISQALATKGVNDLRIKPTIDTSGSIDVVVEYLDGLEGI